MRLIYRLGWLAARLTSALIFRSKVTGREFLPTAGGFILASNHISYYDPPLVGSYISRNMYYFGKRELFKQPIIGAILRKVNTLPVRRGTVDRAALDMAVEAVCNGNGLVVFPEGTRSRTGDFLKPKPGVGMIALRADCPIVPVFISGFDRPRDCILGKSRGRISYGEPFSVDWVRSHPADKSGYIAIAEAVMERIGQLRDNVNSVK